MSRQEQAKARRAQIANKQKKRSAGAVKKKTTAELNGTEEKSNHSRPQTDNTRKGSYRFGNSKINYIKPTEGYPNPRDALDKPAAGLILNYAHGYQGKEVYGRGNMFHCKNPATEETSL